MVRKRFINRKALLIAVSAMMFLAGVMVASPSPALAANPVVQQILDLLNNPEFGLQSISDQLDSIEAVLP